MKRIILLPILIAYLLLALCFLAVSVVIKRQPGPIEPMVPAAAINASYGEAPKPEGHGK